MSYDEGFFDAKQRPNPPKVKRVPRQSKVSKRGFHVCIPLYRGIPKEMQSGWTRMGPHGVLEWDNTTDLLPFIAKGWKVDRNFYCGTCGRLMVKGRNKGMKPLENTKVIKLV